MKQTNKRGAMGCAVLMLLGVFAATALGNDPPVVSNVTASQRTDGSKILDVYYDLADTEGDPCLVEVQASSDGGSTWTVPIASATGDVGPGVISGTGKHIVWDCAVDLPGAFGSQYKVRVCADDTPPGMVLIPAGEYEMGDTFGEGDGDDLPVHSVYLSPYYIDTHEVTNHQYADALNWALAQGGLITVTSGVVYEYNSGTSYPYCHSTTSSSYSRITWNGSTFGVVGEELPLDDLGNKTNHPMVMVSWYGSVAYANWRSAMEGRPLCYDLSTWTCNFGVDGYRLPTEAEWEKAARGGVAGHRFPWSDTDTIQHARANYNSSTSYSYDTSPTRGYHPTFNTGGMPYYTYTSPVGYFAPNGYGVYDMAGNAWEWCNDWYSGSYYSGSPSSNPTGPGSGSWRVIRGGGWDNLAVFCRVADRISMGHGPGHVNNSYGFRVALNAD